MKILYLPLDERPCNLLYPFNYTYANQEIEMVTIPQELLGYKKNPASIDKIWTFIEENVQKVDAVVGSFDTLIYGSLLNSRLHQNTLEELLARVQKIKNLKKLNKNLKIYGFSLIMRTPKYNSSDEEPDYYQEHGENIFYRKFLQDKKTKVGLSIIEENQLNAIKIPQQYINDYEKRRNTNLQVLGEIIKLYNNQIIDFMSIPQDDSAEYGYTALDQKEIFSKFENKLITYSGADEAGSALLAKYNNDQKKLTPKIAVFYPNNATPDFNAMYEDRTITTNLKSHIEVVGGIQVENFANADFVIAYNITNSEQMCESWDQIKNKDNLKDHNENLHKFVLEIQNQINNNKKVIIVDSAYANGGDIELIKLLSKNDLLSKIWVYKGWNTNCNSLGTALANACLIQTKVDQLRNLALSYYEDVIYQAIVRMDVNSNLDKYNCNYFDISPSLEIVEKLIKDKCDLKYHELINNKDLYFDFKIWSPWKRMFELGVSTNE